MSEKVMMDQRFMSERKNITNALAALKQIEAVTYEPQNGFVAYPRSGLVGQSLASTVPTALEVDGMGYHYVEMEQVIPTIVAAVKELSASVSTPDDTLATLTQQLATLQSTVEGLSTSLSTLQSTVTTLQSDVDTLKGASTPAAAQAKTAAKK